MKIVYASDKPRLMSKEYSVRESYRFTDLGAVEHEKHEETKIYLSPFKKTVLNSTSDTESPDKLPNKDEGNAQSKPIRIKDFIEAVPAGGLAAGAMTMYQLSNTTTPAELNKFFLRNNFTPKAADTLTDNVMSLVKSQAGKAGFIGVAGGAAIFSVLEVIQPKWTLKRRLLWSSLVAVVVAITYLILVRAGVMR